MACPLDRIAEEGIRFHDRTFVVVATRGHALDAAVVKALEGTVTAYKGLIGSRKKIDVVRCNLIREGVAAAYLDGIFQPVGLPIRAETPEEIGVSVVAELIAVSRRGDLKNLRRALSEDGGFPIYPRFE